MTTIISFVLTIAFVLLLSKSLKKHPIPYYIGASVVAAAVLVIQVTAASRHFPIFVTKYIWPLFFLGGLAGAMFVTIMWTGAAPVKSRRIKKLMPVRGELSIIASILGLGHAAANSITYMKLITRGTELSAVMIIFIICSIIMVLVMLPLFITSFKSIRRKMNPVKWKKLQRLAYVFYGLMFAHVSLLYIPYLLQGHDYWISYIIYCFVFVSYAICRVFKAILKNVNTKMQKIHIAGNVIAVIITVLLTLLLFVQASVVTMAREAEAFKTEREMVVDGSGEGEELTDSEELPKESGEIISSQAETEQASETSKEQEQTEAETETAAEKAAQYYDGTYTGVGMGYEGEISLTVTVENDMITWIEPGDNIEDPEFYVPALAVIEDVINKQHTNIDAVSGSTYSSYGILDAIDDALSKARR